MTITAALLLLALTTVTYLVHCWVVRWSYGQGYDQGFNKGFRARDSLERNGQDIVATAKKLESER